MEDNIEINYQAVYYCQHNSAVVALNIIAFGVKEFRRSYIFQNLNLLEIICSRINDKSPRVLENLELSKGFVINNLIDCVRISLCFENFFKAFLLIRGFIIHKLDKNIFPDLYKEQFKRPIHLNEIKKLADWEINPKVQTDITGLKNQIKGITKNTLGISTLTNSGYKKEYGITNDFITVCKPYFDYRNNLHYYIGDSISLSSSTKANFDRIVKFVRTNMITRHDDLIEALGKGDEYKIHAI